MKKIMLRSCRYPGLFAIVDDDDFDRVNAFKWYAHNNNGTGRCFYAYKNPGKRNSTRLLHRFILNLFDRSPSVDHINGNGLDCRKENLRTCSHQQNCFNRRQSRSKSGFLGVYWHPINKKFQALIRKDGKKISLGYFRNAKDASKAHEAKAKELFGPYYRPPE